LNVNTSRYIAFSTDTQHPGTGLEGKVRSIKRGLKVGLHWSAPLAVLIVPDGVTKDLALVVVFDTVIETDLRITSAID
jgi:hypothetical protein